MLLSSETVIKPGRSQVYLRLIWVLYLITVFLIFYSPTYVLIKLVFLMLSCYWLAYYLKMMPTDDIIELRLTVSQWVLIARDGQLIQYEQGGVLIHNPLFQLIQLTKDQPYEKTPPLNPRGEDRGAYDKYPRPYDGPRGQATGTRKNLIKSSKDGKKKLLVLFNDQVTPDQLRLLHVYSSRLLKNPMLK